MNSMNQIGDILSYLFSVISGYYLYLLTSSFITYRKGLVAKILLIMGYDIIAFIPVMSHDVFNIIAVLILHIGMLLTLTHASMSNRLAVLFIFFPIIIAISFFRFNTGLWQNVDPVNEQATLIRNTYVVLSSSIIALLHFLLYRMLKPKVKELKKYMRNEDWRHILVVCLIPFLALFVAQFALTNDTRTVTSNKFITANLLSYFLMLGTIITNVGIICLLQPLIESVKIRGEQRTYQLQKEYYETLEEQQKQVRKIRHDMNNHMQMIQGYLHEGNVSLATEYMEKFEQNLTLEKGRLFCKDRALNALLNNFYHKLLEEKAEVHFNIAIDDLTEIDTYDLCTIFSNTLDNAYEATSKTAIIEKRLVTLQARREKGYFSFQIRNYKENLISEKNGQLASDKTRSKNHGLGLGNIRDIVDKYGGTMDIQYEDASFVVFLYIKLN